ncbi:MAG: MerR family DNA-binding transcriptional regulator [Solobacterium sp.]|jgi:DNA-binding transcriptional MerR regulator|nr:MerR family DNA-binding transcriptional regulator [Solobacterium sp.]MCH4265256.1 MerR family DNA-binding transcriptional regulator [Solobacterium sp.]
MNYKIGEASELLGISKEMIRYYEKCGVIHPVRAEGSQYRTYTIMDLFAMFEMLQRREWGLGIKDLPEIMKENSRTKMMDHLRSYSAQLEEEIAYKTLVHQRVNELIDWTQSGEMNRGNFWVQTAPESYAGIL